MFAHPLSCGHSPYFGLAAIPSSPSALVQIAPTVLQTGSGACIISLDFFRIFAKVISATQVNYAYYSAAFYRKATLCPAPFRLRSSGFAMFRPFYSGQTSWYSTMWVLLGVGTPSRIFRSHSMRAASARPSSWMVHASVRGTKQLHRNTQ